MRKSRFFRLSEYLQQRYGQRVFKVSVHTGLSCPNRDGRLSDRGCTFCLDQTLHPLDFDPDRSVTQQLDAGMRYITQRYGANRFIAYFQDYCATYGDPKQLQALYEPALHNDAIVGLAVSTRPDCLPDTILDLLARIAKRKDLWVEIGLQIADDALLADINRHHTVDDFANAVRTCHACGLRVCAHVIIGLPGADAATERQTAALLASLGVWGVKLHAFFVPQHTVMAERFAAGDLSLLSQQDHVTRVVDFLERLPSQVVVHRVAADAPRRLTIAPKWTINKLRVYDAVVDALQTRQTWQGRCCEPTHGNIATHAEI